MPSQIDDLIEQLRLAGAFIDQAEQAKVTLATLTIEITNTNLTLTAYKERLGEAQLGLSEAEQTNIRVYNEAITERLTKLDSINSQIASAQNILNSINAKAQV